MRVLALETSQRQATLAAILDDSSGGQRARCSVLSERTLAPEERTAQSLVPAINEMLASCLWRPADVELICVSTGPGSFTGLRLGVTAAKTLAYATEASLVGVPTMAAIAARASADGGRLWTVLDAQRRELFSACFSVLPGKSAQPLVPTSLLSIDCWLEQVCPGDTVSGPPVASLLERFPTGVVASPAASWAPRAVEVGQLGAAAFHRGEAIDPMQLVPQYYRRSAAEEKADC
ncbi:MAG: tRNA (adenosine(37)-N6)-threonylcarbamoyltransferase complex dimerization subunit type 1 TsaB [Pirellulales bacterium]|nr:tRNA (adenosine(37)-N6)-threonylcarbamoyltransferase complex dimerization subunit type 1 TsaB [Pirellulales bacterium]